ncbi:hypothetical protein ABZT17_27940 [Streptomyces sp. NPDC005648]|uniref:hypothetical protein n=1 Tax=Streptomyces sp. NPDC005648 TaxID=3157044 RepID=UPI0033BC47F1
MRLLVLFDLDNTLVDRQKTLAEWAVEFATRHGLEGEEQKYILGMVAERAYPSTFDLIRNRYRLSMSTVELGPVPEWWTPLSPAPAGAG